MLRGHRGKERIYFQAEEFSRFPFFFFFIFNQSASFPRSRNGEVHHADLLFITSASENTKKVKDDKENMVELSFIIFCEAVCHLSV